MSYEMLKGPVNFWDGTFGSKVAEFTAPVAISATSKRLVACFKCTVADASTDYFTLKINGATATGRMAGTHTNESGAGEFSRVNLGGADTGDVSLVFGYSPAAPFTPGDYSHVTIEIPTMAASATPRPINVNQYLSITSGPKTYTLTRHWVGTLATPTGAIVSIGVATGGGGSYLAASSYWSLGVW